MKIGWDQRRNELFFAILVLQGILQKPKMSNYFFNTTLAMLIFYKMTKGKRFFLLIKFLHFVNNELKQRGSSKDLQSKTCI
jgi:hypothetical protein